MSNNIRIKNGEAVEIVDIPAGENAEDYISRLQLDIDIHNRDHDDEIELITDDDIEAM